jgi:hypothetical protein
VRALLPAVLALLAACHGQPGVLCADGRICADGTTCDGDLCISGDQVLACREVADGASCRIDGRTTGVCEGGICRYPRCGDGIRNGLEACDGDDLGLLRCASYGFYGGTLRCNATCDGVDTAGCAGNCGDGVRNAAEVCDRADLGGLSCQSFGWHGGMLECEAGCGGVDKDGCEGYCGDGIVNGTELCDGTAQAGETCTSLAAVGGAMGCNAYCQPTTDLCQWGRPRAIPQSDDRFFHDVWASGPRDVWVATDRGVAHHDGATWRFQDLGGGTILGVGGSGPGDVWAVSFDGAIHHFDGTGWHEWMPNTPRRRWNAVWSAGPRDAWAVGADIAHFDGLEWRIVDAPSVGWTRNLTAVWGSGPDDVWAVGAFGLVLHYDGVAWTEIDAGADAWLYGVRGTGRDDVWIVGSATVRRFDGSAWRPVAGAGHRTYRDLWQRGGEVWLVSDEGPLERIDHTGWHDVPVPTTERLFGLWITDDGGLWAVGSWGAMVHQRGRGWRIEHAPATRDPVLGGVTISASGVPWALGDGGEVSRYVDGAWQQVAPASEVFLGGLWAHDADLAFVVGAGGLVRRYHHGVWTTEDAGTEQWLYGVWGTGPDDVWAVGAAGTIRHRDRHGWRAMEAPDARSIDGVIGSGPSDVWASHIDGLLHYDGTAWRTSAAFGSGISSMWASGPNDVWAVIGTGLMYRFDGESWNQVDIGAGLAELNAVWGSGPNDVWAVTRLGVTHHWDGATWTPAATGLRTNLYAIGGTGPGDVWIAGEYGAVVRRADPLPTADGGVCAAPAPISCESQVVGAIGDRPGALVASSCGGLGGGETVYRLANPVTGRLSVEVAARGGEVGVSILGADPRGGCDPAACGGTTVAGAAPATLRLDAEQGDVLYLVLTGRPGAAPSFTVDVACDKRWPDTVID